VKDRLNIQVMRSAARLLEGKHDFQSFTERDVESDSTLVHLTKVDIIETENLIAIHIMGSHFLWKMVRRIVGVLVEIGRKKLPVTDITYFLSGYTNEPARYTAPSSGLYLEHVYYEGEKINREMTEIPGVLRLK
jgi:tRNA pseudouridine38-40 synthase